MVEDAISDPTRVAQLLASELTGLATPPLDRVSVVDADESAEPTPEGTVAYAIAVDDASVGRVLLYPDTVTVAFEGLSLPEVHDDRLTVERAKGETRLSLSSGVAVKRAVDVLRDVLDGGAAE